MAHRCPGCGAEYDAALFQFGIAFRCDCGASVRGEHVVAVTAEARRAEAQRAEAQRAEARRQEEEIYREFQRAADRISFLIVVGDYPAVDIEIERRNLRRLCRQVYPHRLDLYEMVYEARFRRLWEQFRGGAQHDDDVESAPGRMP